MHSLDLTTRFESTARARERFLEAETNSNVSGVRAMVLASWQRSGSSQVRPDMDGAPVPLTDDNLQTARQEHILHSVLPLVHQLLVEEGSDMLVAVGDVNGNALWVDGDSAVLRRAEGIHLFAGSSWNEHDIGTNGIGTAIATDSTVQVFGSEHFASGLHRWSCTGAPVHDPRTGDAVGFLDISGGPAIATPQAALLVRSAVAAVEGELRLNMRSSETRAPRPGTARLSVLGRDRAILQIDGRTRGISLRHAELLLLLGMNPTGLSAGELAYLLYEADTADVTVRAEMSRLRKAYPTLVSDGAPYRLVHALDTDVDDVARALRHGALQQAVDSYPGSVLPRSSAPGIVDLRQHTTQWLRAALLRNATADLLLQYARTSDGHLDIEIWRACHARLATDSARVPEVAAMISSLDSSLGIVAT
jgi:hypothetical protein